MASQNLYFSYYVHPQAFQDDRGGPGSVCFHNDNMSQHASSEGTQKLPTCIFNTHRKERRSAFWIHSWKMHRIKHQNGFNPKIPDTKYVATPPLKYIHLRDPDPPAKCISVPQLCTINQTSALDKNGQNMFFHTSTIPLLRLFFCNTKLGWLQKYVSTI